MDQQVDDFMECDGVDPASQASDEYLWRVDDDMDDMDVKEYLTQQMANLGRAQDEEEPPDNEGSSYATKGKPATDGAIDVDLAVPDVFVLESRAVPEPYQSNSTTEEGPATASSGHASAVSPQHPGCPHCHDIHHKHPEFLPKLRERANRDEQLIPELTTLLDNFDNLRLGHVEHFHRPLKERYAELFRYFKDATTVVMADRYAVKEEWQLNDFILFCEALVKGCPCSKLRRIVVLTPQDNFLAPTRRGEPAPQDVCERVKEKWAQLGESLSTEHNVALEFMDFDLHPRKFLSDDGKTIESDRGIHIEDQKHDTDKHSTATTFIYYRTRPDDPIPLAARKWLKSPSPQLLQAATVAESSSSSTTMPQTSSALQPTGTMSWAERAASKTPQNVVTRVIPASSLASKPTTRPASAGATESMRINVGVEEEAVEYDHPKHADQCVNWKNCVNCPSKPPAKRKRLCPYWHPTKDCTRKPCWRFAKRCSFAHPFCSDGGPCKCDPGKRDPQLNHLVPKATHPGAV